MSYSILRTHTQRATYAKMTAQGHFVTVLVDYYHVVICCSWSSRTEAKDEVGEE